MIESGFCVLRNSKTHKYNLSKILHATAYLITPKIGSPAECFEGEPE